MDAPVNTRQTEPHVNPALSTEEIELVARADERLAHAYQQIARADEELARFNEQISRLEKKPANRLRQPSRGRPALRGLIGLLLTAGICTAAFAWQSHGETIRPMISRWAPQLAAASSLPSEAPKLADQQSPPAVQLAAADAAVSQLPPQAQTAAPDAPPDRCRTDAIAPDDGARSRQRAARDRAAQGQPGRTGPRERQDRRAAQGEPGANGARDRQRLRAEPAAQDIGGSATGGAQARAGAPDGSQSANAGARAAAAQIVVCHRRHRLPRRRCERNGHLRIFSCAGKIRLQTSIVARLMSDAKRPRTVIHAPICPALRM